jgi:hypothetical protein
VGVACVLAAHASAAAGPTLFRLTIVGTAHEEWTFTPAAVETGDCRRTETSEGIRTARFRTRAPIVVRLSAGRVLPVDVRGIAGTVTLRGANTTEEICRDGGGTSQIADCAETTRAFAGASVHAVSTRPGVVTLNGIANVRLGTAGCPREPPDVRRRPLGPAPNLVRLPREALLERRLARISVRVSRTHHKAYGSPERGTLDESAKWMLTFVRIKS